MRNSEKVLTELSKQAQNKDYEFHRIYRIICNPDMFIKAYCNIYNNKGSSTSGIDNRTADNFNEDLIDKIINSLKDESYQVKPVKRMPRAIFFAVSYFPLFTSVFLSGCCG